MMNLMGLNSSAQTVLSLSVMLMAGFLLTRATKRLKLPNVTGYILAGVLIGPYMLRLIPQTVIDGMQFITDTALAVIAFGVGKYFKLSQLRKSGARVLVITAMEALVAAAVITAAMLAFRLPLSFALLLGAIGSATAPASTIMTIRQYRAKGEFVNIILQVVALDDAVALIAFSVCIAVAQALDANGAMNISVFLLPLALNALSILLGVGCGFLLNWVINARRSQEHRLALSLAVILGLTGFCSAFDISPLLSCMALGIAYVNLCDNKDLFKQISRFSPPILLLFFVESGMRLNVPSLATAGVIGVVYFLVRIAGKYAGAYLGCGLCHTSEPIRRYLGLALIPQAGVSIGLAALGQRVLPGEMGVMLSTIILSSGVLYEMVGPACAKASLFLSHTITLEGADAGKAAKEPPNNTRQPKKASLKKQKKSEAAAHKAQRKNEANVKEPRKGRGKEPQKEERKPAKEVKATRQLL